MASLTVDQLHTPVVTKHRDGWGVHCLACSEMQGDYVYPCQFQLHSGLWPPAILVEPT